MKKALTFSFLLSVGTFLFAQAQLVPGETNTNTGIADTPEQIVFTPVDYLSSEQIDLFWYLADTAKVLPTGIIKLYKGSVYITALLRGEKKKESILVLFNWHTGRIETYEVWKKGKIAYKLVRNPNDTFRSTDEYGYKEVDAPVEKLLTDCRTVYITTANKLLKKQSNS